MINLILFSCDSFVSTFSSRKILFIACFYYLPFVRNAPFLYPLKIAENRKVFLMFSGGTESVQWEQMG